MVGVVGVIDDVSTAVRAHFTTPGDRIILLGEHHEHLGASSYWHYGLGARVGRPPHVDLEAERHLIDLLVELARQDLMRSCHDLSDGGIGLALAESCIGGPYDHPPLGADIDLRSLQSTTPQAVLFAENHGRALLSVAPDREADVIRLAHAAGVVPHLIGSVGDPEGVLDVTFLSETVRWEVTALRDTYMNAIPKRMASTPMQAG